jgi:hypothetical protein
VVGESLDDVEKRVRPRILKGLVNDLPDEDEYFKEVEKVGGGLRTGEWVQEERERRAAFKVRERDKAQDVDAKRSDAGGQLAKVLGDRREEADCPVGRVVGEVGEGGVERCPCGGGEISVKGLRLDSVIRNPHGEEGEKGEKVLAVRRVADEGTLKGEVE